MSWIREALEERAWTREEITIAGRTGFAWMRRLSPSEHAHLWKTMVAPISGVERSKGDPNPDEVLAQVEASKQVVLKCWFADDDGKRLDDQLFDETSIELLSTEELADLCGRVTRWSGITKEVIAAAEHFQEAS